MVPIWAVFLKISVKYNLFGFLFLTKSNHDSLMDYETIIQRKYHQRRNGNLVLTPKYIKL